jgi:hypothetical protein
MSVPRGTVVDMDAARSTGALEDERDIELCEAIKARNEHGVPHDVFMASLDAA